jgi:hypothetical protein
MDRKGSKHFDETIITGYNVWNDIENIVSYNTSI